MNNKLGIYLPLNKNLISLPNPADRPINLNNINKTINNSISVNKIKVINYHMNNY